MKRQAINSADLLQDESGALVVRGGMEGLGKPDLLSWATGDDTWTQADSGAVTHDSSVVFIRVGSGGALVSIGDAVGQEKSYLIPPNYWRELVIPGGIPASSRIVAKNLVSGVNFSDLYVEVR